MPLNSIPFRGLIISLLLFGLTLLSPLAAGRKHKSVEVESKSKAKSAQKNDPKQQAKSVRNARQDKEDRSKQQIALKKRNKEEEQDKKKNGKPLNKLAQQREEQTRDKARGKDKTAKHEAEKKNDKTKDRLAKREEEKKNEKAKDKKDKLAKRETDKSLEKKEAAKKSQLEKNAKNAKASKETESAEPKSKVSARAVKVKEDAKTKLEEKGKDLAKQEKVMPASHLLAKSGRSQETAVEEKSKELPSTKFALHPIAKPMSKVELKFGLARAVGAATFDAPPPRDLGPDVIDVIEYDSPETKRLEELFRSEVKTVQPSSNPSVSRKKLDVGRMDAERIRQIQECLAKKGYYAGEISGQYSDITIEAMRKFQEEHKIDVTGYATAQSLRLLGLTDW